MSKFDFSDDFKIILGVLNSNSPNVEFCYYDYANNNKFQCHVRPSLKTYYDVYLKLVEGDDMNYSLFSDILLIGLNLKDFKGKYIYNVPTSPSKKILAKSSSKDQNIIIYTQNSLIKYAKEKNVDIPLPPRKESDFKNYMEVLCTIMMQLMYSNSKKIFHKLNNVAEGMKILSLPYTSSQNCLKFDKDFIEMIRNVAKDHLWKPIIGVIVIKTYLNNIETNKKKIKSFLEWQMMQDLFLYNFGIFRLMTKFIEITQCTIDQFIDLFYCDSIETELEKTYKIFKKIITVPSESFEEWIYFKYCALIDENLMKNFKLKNFPKLSSMLISFLNSLLSLDEDQILLEEFPYSLYSLEFSGLGYRLSKYFNIPFTCMIEESSQVLKDIKDEISEDQLNTLTLNISKTHEKFKLKIKEKICGICLEEICFKTKKKFGLLKNCKHVFCFDCINLWLNDPLKRTCPECRCVIDSIKISSKYIEDQDEKNKLFNIIPEIVNEGIEEANEYNSENNISAPVDNYDLNESQVSDEIYDENSENSDDEY